MVYPWGFESPPSHQKPVHIVCWFFFLCEGGGSNKAAAHSAASKATVQQRQPQPAAETGSLSKLSPTAAANMLSNDRKLDERMRQIYAQNNARLAQIEARASAKGDGNGKGAKGGDIDGEAMDILDRKKFNDAYLNDDASKQLDGDRAHSWALQLYTAAQRESGVVPYKTRAEIVRMAKDMAAGKKMPGVHFDDETLQFRHGVMDEGGNFRPLKPGAVAHNAINTSTNTPFFDDAGKKKAEIGGLTKFSQQDPAGYRQAFELSQSKTPKELEAIAQQNPAFAKYANAARLIQLYPPKTDKAPAATGNADKTADTGSGRQMLPGNTFAERQAAYAEKSKRAEQDPELIQLQEGARKLLRAGKAVDANIALSQYKKLKQERYGL